MLRGGSKQVWGIHVASCYDRAFSVAAPRAWNWLPTLLKLLRSTTTFRRQLKTFCSSGNRLLIVLSSVGRAILQVTSK